MYYIHLGPRLPVLFGTNDGAADVVRQIAECKERRLYDAAVKSGTNLTNAQRPRCSKPELGDATTPPCQYSTLPTGRVNEKLRRSVRVCKRSKSRIAQSSLAMPHTDDDQSGR